MPSAFDKAVEVVFDQEGFESNYAADPGGFTRFGITAISLAEAKRLEVVPQALELKDITRDEAKAAYKALYWNPIKGDTLPAAFGLALFDSAVNMGVDQAIRTTQKALQVTVDGILGPKTLAAIKDAGDNGLDRALAERALFYADLATMRPSLQRFRLGWIRRCFTIARIAAKA